MPVSAEDQALVASRYLNSQMTDFDKTIYAENEEAKWGALPNGQNHHPAQANLPIGAQFVGAQIKRFSGEAESFGGANTSIPTVATDISGETYPVDLYIIRDTYTRFDLYNEAMANRGSGMPSTNLIKDGAAAIRMGMDRKTHALAWKGNANLGITGMLNNESINREVVAGVDLYTMSPEDLLIWFTNLLSSFKRRTRLTTNQIEIKVPTALKSRLTLPISNMNGQTPWQRLTDERIGATISAADELNELQAADLFEAGILPDSSLDRIMIGRFNSPRAMKRRYYAMDRTKPMTSDGINYVVTAWMASTGMLVHDSTYFRYVDIQAAPPVGD